MKDIRETIKKLVDYIIDNDIELGYMFIVHRVSLDIDVSTKLVRDSLGILGGLGYLTKDRPNMFWYEHLLENLDIDGLNESTMESYKQKLVPKTELLNSIPAPKFMEIISKVSEPTDIKIINGLVAMSQPNYDLTKCNLSLKNDFRIDCVDLMTLMENLELEFGFKFREGDYKKLIDVKSLVFVMLQNINKIEAELWSL